MTDLPLFAPCPTIILKSTEIASITFLPVVQYLESVRHTIKLDLIKLMRMLNNLLDML